MESICKTQFKKKNLNKGHCPASRETCPASNLCAASRAQGDCKNQTGLEHLYANYDSNFVKLHN